MPASLASNVQLIGIIVSPPWASAHSFTLGSQRFFFLT
jgi:hypothetical protein